MTAIKDVEQDFVEKRRYFRYLTKCRAWLEFDDHAPPRPCTIVDISGGGARIAVPAPHNLPEEFLLVLAGPNIKRRTRIAWRGDKEIGVSYVGAGG